MGAICVYLQAMDIAIDLYVSNNTGHCPFISPSSTDALPLDNALAFSQFFLRPGKSQAQRLIIVYLQYQEKLSLYDLVKAKTKSHMLIQSTKK